MDLRRDLHCVSAGVFIVNPVVGEALTSEDLDLSQGKLAQFLETSECLVNGVAIAVLDRVEQTVGAVDVVTSG